jgi:nitrate reductase gamma subunit
MDMELLELGRADRARYFAPAAICGYLAALCVAVAVTSAFVVTLAGAVAVTAVGVGGALALGALGLLLYRAQQRERRYRTVATGGDGATQFDAVLAAVRAAGWHITRHEAGRRLEAQTAGAMRLAGERVAVRFDGGAVRVASICDPTVGFTLAGRRRCAQHRELVRRVLATTRSS